MLGKESVSGHAKKQRLVAHNTSTNRCSHEAQGTRHEHRVAGARRAHWWWLCPCQAPRGKDPRAWAHLYRRSSRHTARPHARTNRTPDFHSIQTPSNHGFPLIPLRMINRPRSRINRIRKNIIRPLSHPSISPRPHLRTRQPQLPIRRNPHQIRPNQRAPHPAPESSLVLPA